METEIGSGTVVRGSLWMLLLAVIAMLGLAAYAWFALPAGARIPTHWNIHGEIDGTAPKAVGLLITPAMLVVVSAVILLAARFDPRRQHVVQSQPFLRATMLGLALFLLSLQAAIVLTALGVAVPMNQVVLSLVGALFILLGAYSGKVRSNYFAGVRTPWTLSSELSWNKTNRLAGRLFVASGLLTVVLAWVASEIAVYVLLVSVVGTAAISIVYSYRVWKQDPDAQAGR